jgi:hypothetical protein
MGAGTMVICCAGDPVAAASDAKSTHREAGRIIAMD